MEVIAYSAKTVPEGFRSRSILDLEVYSILNSLYSMQRFISGVKVTLLTDSRVLYYLFSAKIGNSCVRIKRWVLKMISDYPMVVLHCKPCLGEIEQYNYNVSLLALLWSFRNLGVKM
jgi:hypothetical protein